MAGCWWCVIVEKQSYGSQRLWKPESEPPLLPKCFSVWRWLGKHCWRGLVSCRVGLRSVSHLYFKLSHMWCKYRSPGFAAYPNSSPTVEIIGYSRIRPLEDCQKRIGGITVESRPCLSWEKCFTVLVKRKQVVNWYGPDIAAISLVGPCGVLIYSYFPVIHTGS